MTDSMSDAGRRSDELIRAAAERDRQRQLSPMTCIQCGTALNPRRPEEWWNFVTGWEKKREAGGTNHIALRKQQDSYCCNVCMQRMLDNVDPGQQTLL